MSFSTPVLPTHLAQSQQQQPIEWSTLLKHQQSIVLQVYLFLKSQVLLFLRLRPGECRRCRTGPARIGCLALKLPRTWCPLLALPQMRYWELQRRPLRSQHGWRRRAWSDGLEVQSFLKFIGHWVAQERCSS